MRLFENVAWVSGGAQGIGFEIAKALSKKGCRVAIVDMCNEERGMASAQQCGEGAIFIRCDVLDSNALRESLRRAAGALGVRCPTIFFNNAGIVDENKLSQMVDLNLKAVIDGTLAQEEFMRVSGTSGVIINTASIAGLAPMALTPAYVATKWGVVGFTLSIAAKLSADAEGKTPVARVNALCPALTDTPTMGARFKDTFETAGGDWKKLNRYIMPASVVAAAAIQLVEDESMHGQLAIVSGKDSWLHQPRFEPVFVKPQGATVLSRL